MRRILSILVILLAFAAVFFFAKASLPHLFSLLLSSLLKGQVKVEAVHLGLKDGLFRVSLERVRTKGEMEGTIGGIDVLLTVFTKPAVRGIGIKDFDIRITDLKKARSPALPFECLELTRGRLQYKDYGVTVREFTARKSGDGLVFEGVLQGEGLFGTLSLKGRYGGKEDVSTAIRLSSLSLRGLHKGVQGFCDVDGIARYKGKRLSLEGTVKGDQVALGFSFLKRPLHYRTLHGLLHLEVSKGEFDLSISSLNLSASSPFFLQLKGKDYRALFLRLSSEPFPLEELKQKVDLDRLLKRDISSHVSGGRIRIESLEIKEGDLRGKIRLKGVTFTYKNLTFKDVKAELEFDRGMVRVQDSEGNLGASQFEKVSGKLSLDGRVMEFNAHYRIDLRDVPSLLDTKDLRFAGGFTSGYVEGKRTEEGLKFSAKGTIERGEASWRKLDFGARGTYTLTEREIAFDPLVLTRGSFQLTLKGCWRKDLMRLLIRGGLDAEDLARLYKLPFEMGGPLWIDSMLIEGQGKVFKFKGSLELSSTSVVLRDVFEKASGVECTVKAEGSWDGRSLDLRTLVVRLGSSYASLRGRWNEATGFEGDVSVRSRDMNELKGPATKYGLSGGSIEANLSVSGLKGSIRGLPRLKGDVLLRGVSIVVPPLPNPISNLNLSASLQGERLEFDLSSLTCGGTVVKKGILTIAGLDNPALSLSLQLESFSITDFLKRPGMWRFPVIRQDSFLGKARGEFHVESGHADLGPLKGDRLAIDGSLREGRVFLSHARLELFKGSGEIRAFLDLSREVPEIRMEGTLTRVELRELLRLLGASPSSIEGRAEVVFDLHSSGRNSEEIIRGITGKVSFQGKDGVIKKWNLLSKIFGILNLYDLLRGKADLRKEGLPYRKISGTFSIKEGQLTTRDFLIDSPSMLVKGDGSIDLRAKKLEGYMVISPLVALDKTIEKLPVIRKILREKRKGFLHATLKITGSTSEPEVTLSTLETITGSLLDVIKRVITFPWSPRR